MDQSGKSPSAVFAARLKEIRDVRPRMSQAALAKRLTDAGRPIQKAAINHIENCKRGLLLDEAIAIAAELHAVPAHMLTPNDGEMVALTGTKAVDGEGMVQWLRYGDAFVAHGGDLPDVLIADRAREGFAREAVRAIGSHAQALVDARRGNNEAGANEAVEAILNVALAYQQRDGQ